MSKIIDFETYLLELTQADGTAFDIPALLRMEDEAGVDIAVVMPAPVSVKTGEIYMHPDNASVARAIKGNARCIGCASINPMLGQAAVAELEQYVTKEGFKGVKLNSELHKYAIDDPLVDPVMAKVRELGIVASIHSAVGNCEPNMIGNLAKRFPEVPIIMDHMGYIVKTDDAIRVAQECANVVLGTTILRFFPKNLEDASFDAITKAVKILGPQKVVFGSNAPEFARSPLWTRDAIERLKLGDAAEEMIFSENLAKLYKVD